MAYAMISAKWSCLRKLHHTVNIILMWTKLENVLIIFNLMIIFKWHEHGFVLGMKFKNVLLRKKRFGHGEALHLYRGHLCSCASPNVKHMLEKLFQRRIWWVFLSVYTTFCHSKNICLPAFYSPLTLNWRQF